MCSRCVTGRLACGTTPTGGILCSRKARPRIHELRDELRKAHTLAEAGDTAGVVDTLEHALGELADSRRVTVAEAASLLGVRSADVLAVVMRLEGVPIERRDGTFVMSLSEVERASTSDWVRDLRTSDLIHDLSSDLGREMTPEELDVLEAGRPGRLPWDLDRNRDNQPA